MKLLRDPLADWHDNPPLVNTGSAIARYLFGGPAHHIGNLMIGQAGKESGARGWAGVSMAADAGWEYRTVSTMRDLLAAGV